MSDTLAARIRTLWPILLGHIATWVGAFAVHKLGFSPDLSATVELAAVEAVSAGASWAAWELGRWLEARPNPTLAAVGRWLISAGRQIGAPTYGQNGAKPQSSSDTRDS